MDNQVLVIPLALFPVRNAIFRQTGPGLDDRVSDPDEISASYCKVSAQSGLTGVVSSIFGMTGWLGLSGRWGTWKNSSFSW